MNRVFVIFLAVILNASCTQEKQISTVQEYLSKFKSITTRVDFPFDVVHNQLLPTLTGGGDYYAFGKSLKSNQAYFYKGYKKKVKVCNINNSTDINTISFPILESFPFMRFEFLGNNLSVCSGDSTNIFLFDNSGPLQREINLPLSYINKQFSIFTGPRRLMEYFPAQNMWIIPVNCTSEYDNSETRNLPQFVTYNLNDGNVDFLPIYLPANYPVDKYLGELSFPLTA